MFVFVTMCVCFLLDIYFTDIFDQNADVLANSSPEHIVSSIVLVMGKFNNFFYHLLYRKIAEVLEKTLKESSAKTTLLSVGWTLQL